MDDKSLIAATLAGDADSFGALVRKYQHILVASARHLTRNAEDAEDLAQEALVDAYRNLRVLKDQGKFRPWLFGILRHKCLTYLQRRKPEGMPLDDMAEIPAPPTDDGADVAALLDGLPLPMREILAARYVQELSYEEMAESLGTSVSNVRVRVCRARERLRELFANRGRVEGGASC